jgi:Tfp pilus assembly protein FimT
LEETGHRYRFFAWCPQDPILHWRCVTRYKGTFQQRPESARHRTDKGVLGFTFLEVVIVLSLALIVAVIAIPSLHRTLEAYRGTSAIHGIAGQLALSRMRAGSDFTRTKLVIDTTNKTYVRQVYNKTSSTYEPEGGTQYLGQGVSFGFGPITTPAGGQSTISQTAEIIFNSRGIPITNGGTPIGSYVIYLNNDAGTYYAASVNTTGQIRTWKYSASAWVDE